MEFSEVQDVEVPAETVSAAAPERARLRRWSVVFLWIGFVLALMLLTEITARASLVEAFQWLVDNTIPSAVAATLTGALFLLCAAVAGFRFGGLLALLGLALLSTIHATKQLLVGQPLFPWDLMLSRQGIDIFSGGYLPHPRLHVAAFLVATLACAGWVWALPRPRLRWWQRLLLLVPSAAFILSVSFYRHVPHGGIINGFGHGLIFDCTVDQPLNYRTNGMLLAFAMNVQLSVVATPPQYSRHRVQEVLRHLASNSPVAAPGSWSVPAAPIDLIVVMNEAFWDPAELPGVTFHPDATPYLHSLPQENRSWLISPVFGGWTCNSEFELLTSFSMSFLPQGSVPYQQHVSRPLPSLFRFLGEQGYRTLFMHPYHGWFWQRKSVYPLLGAEESIFLEDCGPTQAAGHFTADAWLAEKIIHMIEANGDRPLCLFAVTIQNHGPYDDDRYGARPAIAVESNLPPASQRPLAVYAHGAADSDRMLQTLADYVRGRSRPTLLVFFGDHLPYLGRDYEIYRQTGFIGSEGDLSWQEHCRLHRVPVAWSANFPVGSIEKEMSMCFLSPWILRQMGLEPTPHMRLAEKVAERYPILTPWWYTDASGGLHELDEAADLLEDYRLLQYDLLFGERYALQPTDTNQ